MHKITVKQGTKEKTLIFFKKLLDIPVGRWYTINIDSRTKVKADTTKKRKDVLKNA